MSTTDAAAAVAPMYKVGVAFNNTPGSLKALQTAVDLCMNMKVPYMIYIAFVVALNPPALLPGMDSIEQGFNTQIHEDAKKELTECKAHLDVFYRNKANYEFVNIEGEGDTAQLLKEYFDRDHPDLNLFVVGTTSKTMVGRMFLGSVSDFLVHNMAVPVLVVKNEPAKAK
ncbi:hypothetical protein SmJEL517_g03594 [Synchytrium microbalum]|uniref:UspA domain-containing protein n=1 Tax=Synchytrium microbalum TaxID=1806994 RepID=A0A507C627_9FUNG|nr:uncharacterized protein SmJEL517_g03594 [Synchytrium microbalum]TPX33514.1 hypothetical protein SmJEL517_g03594 [Synchytrium microbalum]